MNKNRERLLQEAHRYYRQRGCVAIRPGHCERPKGERQSPELRSLTRLLRRMDLLAMAFRHNLKGDGSIIENWAFFDCTRPDNIAAVVVFSKGYGVY